MIEFIAPKIEVIELADSIIATSGPDPETKHGSIDKTGDDDDAA